MSHMLILIGFIMYNCALNIKFLNYKCELNLKGLSHETFLFAILDE